MYRFILKTVQDRAIVSYKYNGRLKVSRTIVWNDAMFRDLER